MLDSQPPPGCGVEFDEVAELLDDDQERDRIEEAGDDRMRRELDDPPEIEHAEKDLPQPGEQDGQRRRDDDQLGIAARCPVTEKMRRKRGLNGRDARARRRHDEGRACEQCRDDPGGNRSAKPGDSALRRIASAHWRIGEHARRNRDRERHAGDAHAGHHLATPARGGGSECYICS